MANSVIWRDTYYTSEKDVLSYRIVVDGDLIFSGKAYKAPDADELKINVSKICQNYLNNDISLSALPITNTVLIHPEAFRIFTLQDEGGNNLETFRFLYGWNYDPNDQAPVPYLGEIVLSDPINGHYSGHQWRPITVYSGSTSYPPTGGVYTRTHANSGYTTEVPCAQYALIYLNAKGGWDSFLFEGTCVREDNIQQYTTNKSFNNQTAEFERSRYISEIDTTYQCNTGWLTDEQAQKFAWHLVNTNKAYLHNLITDEIKPVLITESNVRYQTYQTNGLRMAQYKIGIKESQQKIRR